MFFFYNIGIHLFVALLQIVSLWNSKVRKMLRGRKNWKQHLRDTLPQKKNTRIWFHCASLGEFEMARPVIEKIQFEFPEWEVIVTFFSPSGYELRQHFLCEGVYYLPFDTYKNAKQWFHILNPDMAVFVKYEFWLNYMRAGLEAGCNMFSISTVFREGQFFFEPWAAAWKNQLARFRRIFVQNEASMTIGKEEGLPNIIVAGDNRYDRVLDTVFHSEELPLIAAFKSDKKLLIAGSSWTEEEIHLFEYISIKSWPMGWKIIIAPHDISEMHLRDIEDRFSDFGVVRFSRFSETEQNTNRIMLIDNIGMLSRIYRYGEAAIIGGAWGKGLHNILEPAAFGLPILFGPKYQKFPEAEEAIEAGFAFSAKDYGEFEIYLNRMLGNVEWRTEASRKATEFVKIRSGSTEIVMEFLRKVR